MLAATIALLAPVPAGAQSITDVITAVARTTVEPTPVAEPDAPTDPAAHEPALEPPVATTQPEAASRGAATAPPQRPEPPEWPRLVTTARSGAKTVTSPAARQAAWPQTEIDLARARCRRMLKGLDIVVAAEEPIREGTACGDPAPVTLVSVGTKPQVALSPPVVVNCDLAVAVHGWVTQSLQPLARTHLGGPLVSIETMSSYACRNAYGRADTRLSEHGRANALDISGFITSGAQGARLLADWGATDRDKEQAIAAKARQERLASARLEAERRAADARKTVAPEPDPAHRDHPDREAPTARQADATMATVRATILEGVPSGLSILPNLSADARAGFGFEASRLGGPGSGMGRLLVPPPLVVGTAGRAATIDKARFLREAHASACRRFGTVLGPEANNAHRNHFHIDLADRGSDNFCQ
ncbi:MAG: extensin family protein [Hyphomicrobiaceae bacterium]|nr:extensin family protein [Hyphomicrobiaceae bacterium]